MIDEDHAEDDAALALGPAEWSSREPKTVALLRAEAAAAVGASPVCLEWGTGRALMTGASEGNIADALLAIAPVTAFDQVVSAAPGVANAPRCDAQVGLLAQHVTRRKPAAIREGF